MYPFGGILVPMLFYTLSAILGSAEECEDQAPWCRKLGSRRVPLSRCYKEKNEKRCCASCRRLRLPIQGCPYGDKQGWCSMLGKERPTSECYVHNQTCCQTCHLFDSGIPSCPFGDKASWCTQIGSRYMMSSCYDHASYCCGTCSQYRRNDPNCMFGDRQVWCSEIGSSYTVAHCDRSSGATSCCDTCKKLKSQTPGPTDGLVTCCNTTSPEYHSSVLTATSSTIAKHSTTTSSPSVSDVHVQPSTRPAVSTTLLEHSTEGNKQSKTTTTVVSSSSSSTTTTIIPHTVVQPATTAKSADRTTQLNTLHFGIVNNDTVKEGSAQDGEEHSKAKTSKAPSLVGQEIMATDSAPVDNITHLDSAETAPDQSVNATSESKDVVDKNKDISRSGENDVSKDYLGDSVVSGSAATMEAMLSHALCWVVLLQVHLASTLLR